MADVVSRAVRSRMMAGIRGTDTRAERTVRRLLFASGFRFRLHRRDLPGTPDVVLPGRRVAVFVHGCFWHAHAGCRYAKLPATRPEFWEEKLRANVLRDRDAEAALRQQGWRVLCVWECATRVRNGEAKLRSAMHDWICGEAADGVIDESVLAHMPWPQQDIKTR